MKMLLTSLLAMLIGVAGLAQSHMNFMGIPIDGSGSKFESELLQKGFMRQEYSGTSRVLAGDFAGQYSSRVLILTYGNDLVWRVGVFSRPIDSWHSLKTDFNKFVDDYTAKYGEPDYVERKFSPLFYEGSGLELYGVYDGATKWKACWSTDNGYIMLTIAGQESDEGFIMIVYTDNMNESFKDISYRNQL